MCGRYVLRDPTALAKTLGGAELAAKLSDLKPRYNVAPTQGMPVLFAEAAGSWGAEQMRWGLVPQWMKPKDGGKTSHPQKTVPAGWFNARGETAATKPAFRAAFKYRRCLVPADGFYEWTTDADGNKQPHLIQLAGDDAEAEPHAAFAFAGLWELWPSPDGSELPTFTVLTCAPNDLMRTLHDRMPVILEPEDHGRWVHGEPEDAADLIRPLPADRMWGTPVDPRVGSPRHDDADLLRPIDHGGDEQTPSTLFGG